MKIGVFTENLSRWGDERYKMLKNIGYDCVDMGISEKLLTLDEAEFIQTFSEWRRMAEDAGIEISQVHGPWRWPPEDSTPENRAERMEKMCSSIRATALLGCKHWVIHPIMPFGIEDLENGKAQETWDLNLAFMKELLVTAKENDVTICLENMPMRKFSLATPADILRFVKAINDEHFKICLDTGHVAIFRDISLADSVRELGDEIRTIHVHDNDGRYDLHRMPHYGIIDWEDFGKALREIQYQGVFSLETAPSKGLPLEAAELIYEAMAVMAKKIIGE